MLEADGILELGNPAGAAGGRVRLEVRVGDEDVVGGVMEGRLVAMGTCPWCCSFLRCGSVTGPHMISFQMLAGPRTCGTRCRRPACNVWGSGCTRNSRMVVLSVWVLQVVSVGFLSAGA